MQKKVIRIMCKLNPRESCRDAFREHGFLTLPCLYILDVALYCRFRCELVRGRDVHRYDTRGGDSYRMQHHRTLASEQLPSQAGVPSTSGLTHLLRSARHFHTFAWFILQPFNIDYRGKMGCGSPGEVRDKKPSLAVNLGTNGLKVTSEPPPFVGQADCLQGQDRSAVTHPSTNQARRC
ncbi:hypothetical protein J6590_098313 [Homalodisca vitripennis]|nr:hypothetical protein J6590_029296 [Homalodisca vitripennis]KAG8260379.1 hypothetical protein J6590_098313 [Homalodisca vitripennis]